MKSGEHDCVFDTTPELLITDIQMPEMSGIEFVLQNVKKGCKIKNVAIMSGRWDNESRDIVKKLNLKRFDKPFRVNAITEWVDSFTNT